MVLVEVICDEFNIPRIWISCTQTDQQDPDFDDMSFFFPCILCDSLKYIVACRALIRWVLVRMIGFIIRWLRTQS
jgi:hypothetical protein